MSKNKSTAVQSEKQPEESVISYKCSQCHVSGVKLWRQYQVFLNHIELLCVDCALKDQDKTWEVHAGGCRESEFGGMTDQIGNLIPAVLTAEGDTFWGYTSTPDDRVQWWKNLPLRVQPASEQDYQRNEDFGEFGDATTPGFFKGEEALKREYGSAPTQPASEQAAEDAKVALLPCPFCGATPYSTRTKNGTQMAKIGCASCGIEFKCAVFGYGDDAPLSKDIASAWNRRAAQPSIGEAYPLVRTDNIAITVDRPDIQDGEVVLLPCPFCGSSPEPEGRAGNAATLDQYLALPQTVRCSNGQCALRYVPGGVASCEWNRRATQPPIALAGEVRPEDWYDENRIKRDALVVEQAAPAVQPRKVQDFLQTAQRIVARHTAGNDPAREALVQDVARELEMAAGVKR